MRIEQKQATIRDLVQDYQDLGEDGVTGYAGMLDIRPAYQREFVYKDAQRDAVIDTVSKGLPLNVFYWAVNHVDATGDTHDEPTEQTTEHYEILDGQQRTMSLAKFVNGEFSVAGIFTADGNTGPRYFNTLSQSIQDAFLDYELLVYVCDGTDDQKLAWFKTINIAGEKLTDQELRNAVYTGPWLTDAKRLFSKTNCWAAMLSADYVKGVPIRQELLETVLGWIARRDGFTGKQNIDEYMSKHMHDVDALELKQYFSNVIEWAKAKFPRKRRELKSVDWAALYDAHGTEQLDSKVLEARVTALMGDDDVTRKAGVYEYVLNGNERALSIRAFKPAEKRTVYEQQQGICPDCKEHFTLAQMHADHIVAWSKGGKTVIDNCIMRCGPCNREKSDDD